MEFVLKVLLLIHFHGRCVAKRIEGKGPHTGKNLFRLHNWSSTRLEVQKEYKNDLHM
jgi:hypothetical protein